MEEKLKNKRERIEFLIEEIKNLRREKQIEANWRESIDFELESLKKAREQEIGTLSDLKNIEIKKWREEAEKHLVKNKQLMEKLKESREELEYFTFLVFN